VVEIKKPAIEQEDELAMDSRQKLDELERMALEALDDLM
jgi:hypothetical protein